MYISLAYRYSLQTTTTNETACWKELEKQQQQKNTQQNLDVLKKEKFTELGPSRQWGERGRVITSHRMCSRAGALASPFSHTPGEEQWSCSLKHNFSAHNSLSHQRDRNPLLKQYKTCPGMCLLGCNLNWPSLGFLISTTLYTCIYKLLACTNSIHKSKTTHKNNHLINHIQY